MYTHTYIFLCVCVNNTMDVILLPFVFFVYTKIKRKICTRKVKACHPEGAEWLATFEDDIGSSQFSLISRFFFFFLNPPRELPTNHSSIPHSLLTGHLRPSLPLCFLLFTQKHLHLSLTLTDHHSIGFTEELHKNL